MRRAKGVEVVRVPRSRRVKGVDFLMTTRAEWIDMAPIYKLIREVRSK